MGMSEISDSHRSYLRKEIAIGCGFNAVLSVVFAWIFFKGVPQIPLWGPMGMAVDLIPTVFMITFVGTMIMTLTTRSRVKSGAIAGIGEPWASHRLLRWLPRNALLRGLAVALLATAILVPASVGVLAGLDILTMPFAPFVGFKIVYGVAVGMLSAPFVLLAALSDNQSSTPSMPSRQVPGAGR